MWSVYIGRQNLFFPGAIRYNATKFKDKEKRKCGVRSPWREYEFWYLVVKQAIIPNLSITHAFEHWDRVKKNLMENPRKRRLQSESLSINYP